MQVACDHCGAKYDLDESEITGRGVRITCPSCSHVFVVYQTKKEESFELEVDLELDDNGELSMDLDGMLESLIADIDEDNEGPQGNESEKSEDKSVDEQSTVIASSAEQNPFASEATPAPDVVEHSSSSEVAAESDVREASQTTISNDQIAALDVNSLNFASVGIKSWKVK